MDGTYAEAKEEKLPPAESSQGGDVKWETLEVRLMELERDKLRLQRLVAELLRTNQELREKATRAARLGAESFSVAM